MYMHIIVIYVTNLFVAQGNVYTITLFFAPPQVQSLFFSLLQWYLPDRVVAKVTVLCNFFFFFNTHFFVFIIIPATFPLSFIVRGHESYFMKHFGQSFHFAEKTVQVQTNN